VGIGYFVSVDPMGYTLDSSPYGNIINWMELRQNRISYNPGKWIRTTHSGFNVLAVL
jgi:hypothetical protein